MSTMSTLDDVPAAGQARRSVLVRRLSILALLVVVVVGLTGFLGDRTGVVEGPSGDGQRLRVEFAESSRPGQDVPFEVQVTDPAGLAPEVTLALTADYLDIYETQGWYPEPSDQTRDGKWVYLTFATEGQLLMIVSFDAYIQPNVSRGRSGEIAVVVDGEPVGPLAFETVLFP